MTFPGQFRNKTINKFKRRKFDSKKTLKLAGHRNRWIYSCAQVGLSVHTSHVKQIAILFCSDWVRGSRFNSARRPHFKPRTSDRRSAWRQVTPSSCSSCFSISSILNQFLRPCLAFLGLCWDMLALCWAIWIYDDICVFLKVQNKRVHLAPGAGCQMNRLILGPPGEGWGYYIVLLCSTQMWETSGVEINSRQESGASNSFGVCPAWVSDSPSRWYRGVRDMAPARAEKVEQDPNYPSRLCFKTLPTGSRNRLLSCDSLQDVKGPLHSKLSIKSFSALWMLSRRTNVCEEFHWSPITLWWISILHLYKGFVACSLCVGTRLLTAAESLACEG